MDKATGQAGQPQTDSVSCPVDGPDRTTLPLGGVSLSCPSTAGIGPDKSQARSPHLQTPEFEQWLAGDGGFE